jgi:acetylornithine/LysW-gamma-L-lysine aminotransferase
MLLVKVGGGDIHLEAIADDLASLDRPFVLLHGANKLRDRLAHDLGRPPQVVESISGYSSVLSDDDAIDVMLASYAGIRNKRLVEALRLRGVNALGLTGLDGGVVEGARNRGIRVRQEGRKLLLRDNSGKPVRVNTPLLRLLLERGFTPVLTVPIAGEDGAALNTENDEVLALLARELGASDVVSLIEEVGLLSDRDDPESLVREVPVADLPLWEERVSGRMRRKIKALRSLFDGIDGAGPVFHLADGRGERPITAALAGAGTVVRGVGGDARSGVDGRGAPDSVLTPETGAADQVGWSERNAAHELDVYGKRGITIVAAEGSVVTDESGRKYIDCIGGNGSLALGHRHPALQAALADQLDRVWCVPGAFVTPVRTRFLERLHEALPRELSHTFLSNSGTESVEAALKIARVHTGRSTLVAALRGFHGRTLGALAVTAEKRYREPFEPLPGDVRRVRYNDPDALRAAIDDSVAAVVLEPVQGEGGVHPADADFLSAAREACDETGALLVFDEVQTGFGRTGRLFAFEHTGVVPDVLCLAKSIAGGLPLGATVVREGIDLELGLHGSTFGGNPLSCAAARATLDVMLDTEVLANADRIGELICAGVVEAQRDVVRDVRRVGAMIGIQLRVPARPYVQALMDEGILALTAGRTVLRLLPPIVMSDEEASKVGSALLRVLAQS